MNILKKAWYFQADWNLSKTDSNLRVFHRREKGNRYFRVEAGRVRLKLYEYFDRYSPFI